MLLEISGEAGDSTAAVETDGEYDEATRERVAAAPVAGNIEARRRALEVIAGRALVGARAEDASLRRGELDRVAARGDGDGAHGRRHHAHRFRGRRVGVGQPLADV